MGSLHALKPAPLPPHVGYRFPVVGNSAGDVSGFPIDAAMLSELEAIREKVFRSMPRECECEHEARIALAYPSKEVLQAALKVMTPVEERALLCTQDVMDANPNCAHAKENYHPNPYDDVIRRLREKGILEDGSWETLVFELESGISGVDNAIAGRRWSLPIVGEAARALQRPNVRRLLEVRLRLLSIMDGVIADAQKAIPAVSAVSTHG